jgi:hypothetical protein
MRNATAITVEVNARRAPLRQIPTGKQVVVDEP